MTDDLPFARQRRLQGVRIGHLRLAIEVRMHFYTIKDAAAAIAAALHPTEIDDEGAGPRIHAEHSYLAALQVSICKNEIVYRDPVTRLPIRQDGIAAFMTSSWCAISVADLNAWLDQAGVGIQLPTESIDLAPAPEQPEKETAETDGWPMSTALASALGPYLVSDRDSDWLKRRLNDADRYPGLLKFRKKVGKKPVSIWNAGGVAVYLVELKVMTWKGAKAALEKHYPASIDLLEGLGENGGITAQSWFPTVGD